MATLAIVRERLSELVRTSPNDDFRVGIAIFQRGWILKSTAGPDVRSGFLAAEQMVRTLDGEM